MRVLQILVPVSRAFRNIFSRVIGLGVYLALLITLAIIPFLEPAFFQANNLFNVFRTAAILSIVSIGQLLVIVGGGIDLSVGSVMTTAVIISADLTRGSDSKLGLAVGVVFVIALFTAAINIFLIQKRNVPPFVATLGTYTLMEGARLLYTKGVPQGAPPPILQTIGRGNIGPIPIPIVISAVICFAFVIILRKTRFGRELYATGSNPEAARLTGVPIQRIQAATYVICSLLATATGLVLGGYIGYADRYLGRNFDLDSISAVVIGGASFTGGVGGVGGTIAGILLMTMLSNIMSILNLDVQLQLVMKGVVIVLAVALYSYLNKNQL